MSNQRKITHYDMINENGGDYDPSDIRTYTCKPLASNPIAEIAIHLSLYHECEQKKRHSAGSWVTTPYGGHFKESSVEFNQKNS